METKSGHTWSWDGVTFLLGLRVIWWTQNPLLLIASLAGRVLKWEQWACHRQGYFVQAVNWQLLSEVTKQPRPPLWESIAHWQWMVLRSNILCSLRRKCTKSSVTSAVNFIASSNILHSGMQQVYFWCFLECFAELLNYISPMQVHRKWVQLKLLLECIRHHRLLLFNIVRKSAGVFFFQMKAAAKSSWTRALTLLQHMMQCRPSHRVTEKAELCMSHSLSHHLPPDCKTSWLGLQHVRDLVKLVFLLTNEGQMAW